jgi:hypothetical protein
MDGNALPGGGASSAATVNGPRSVRARWTAWISVVAVITLGLSAGAMLAEATLLVPYWRSLPASDFLRWFAENEPRLTAFYGPLEVAAAVLALVAGGACALRRHRGSRPLALAAFLAVGVLAMYPLYFEDVNASFVAGTIDAAAVASELARWSAWQWVRVATGIAAFVVASSALVDAARP